MKIFAKVVFFIHVSIHMDFKCKEPPLVTVVLELTKISLKPQLQTMILQFLLEPQLLTAVLKEVSLKPQLVTVVLQFPNFTIIFKIFFLLKQP